MPPSRKESEVPQQIKHGLSCDPFLGMGTHNLTMGISSLCHHHRGTYTDLDRMTHSHLGCVGVPVINASPLIKLSPKKTGSRSSN